MGARRHGGGTIHSASSALLRPPPSSSVLPNPLNPFATIAKRSAATDRKNMILSFFLGLFLPCAGMSAVLIVYICLVRYRMNNSPNISTPAKAVNDKGLSASELQKLPRISGKQLAMGTECAVCLDEIDREQAARMVPGCNHGFHLECADSWLSKRSVCPICRAKVDAQLLFRPTVPSHPPPLDHDKDNPC